MEVRSVVQKEAPMGVPKADRSVVLRVDRMEARWVDWKVDRTEVPRAGHSVVQMEALMGVPKEDRSEVPKVGRSGARMEVLRVARSEDRMEERLEGSGQMVEPAGVLQRQQVGVVEVRRRFPLRVQVGPRAGLRGVLPEVRARALPAWKEAVRAGGQQRGLARPQEVPQEPEMPAHDVLVLVKGEGRWRR